MSTVNLNDLAQVEAAFGRFMKEQLGEGVRVVNFSRCSVGFSWLTLMFDLEPASAEGAHFILQIGPPDGLFAPYSVMPQVLALKALERAQVPVPRAYWHDDSGEVLGAPFFVSQRLPGAVQLPWSIQRAPGELSRALLGQFVEVLGRIHTAPWSEGPMAEAGRGFDPADAALRQIDGWSRRVADWSLKTLPMFAWAERWLRSHAPVAPRISIVHGDYRLGNFLNEDSRITGILDWEMAHLGDPHEDMAWALLPMFNGGSRDLFGLMPRREVYRLYESACGIALDPEVVKFYEVFSLYKSAAINMGAARRAEQGGYNDLRLAAMGTQAAPILRQMHKVSEAPA